MLGKKLIIPVVLIALACSLWADPPVKLQYQGKITQNDIALNGLYDMTFRLYSGSCGGTLLWTEIHNGASQVQVTNGLFNVLLGDITAFPEVSTTFNQPLWLQITVGATVMSPCEAFNPVPYAMYAISSPGSGSVNYWSPNGTHIYSNNTGNVGIGTTDPVGKLAVRQNMTAIGSSFTSPHIKIMASNTVDNTGFVGITYAASTSENYGWSSGALRSTGGQSDFLWKHHSSSALGTEYMRITSTGNVGIATPSPSYKLDVNGDLRVNSPSFPGRDYRISCAGRQEIYANNDLVEFVDGNKCVVVGADGGANDDFFIAVNNEATKFFTADGANQRIGIGTNAPSTKLDVDGTVRIRGGSPAAGRVLTASDANGNATWTTGSSNFIQNLGGIGTTPQQARWRLSWPFTVSTSSDTLTYLLCRPASWNSDAVIYGNLVDIGTVTDGHGQAYYGKVDGSYSSLTGTTAFSGATFSAWDASGNARGGAGSVSISTLRTSSADHNATAYGLTGTANGSALTPSAASGANRMAIVGVHAELNGTINNPATMPDTFRVAALWAVDNKTGGTATSYAGFFDGNVYIDGDLTVTGTGGGGGTIGGSGTTNYITKWNPASTTISNSIIYDNGTNVGIGTGTTTNYKLDIVGGTTSNTALRLRTHGTGTGQETILRFTNTTNNDATNQYSSYIAGIRTDAGGGQALAFGTSTSSAAPVERMRIDPSGNLGIGTTGPLSKLSVNSAGNAAYALYSNGTSTANGGTALFGAQTGVSGTNTYYGVRGQSPLASASGAYCYGVRGDSYRGSYAANSRAYGVMGYAGNATAGYNYAIYGYLMGTGNGAAVYGTTSGDVAIPGIYAGYFNGNVRSTGTLQVGNYILPTADGSSGQVLKTNGSGTLSWQADNTGAGGDNLGNHIATQELRMDGYEIWGGSGNPLYLNWYMEAGNDIYACYNSGLLVDGYVQPDDHLDLQYALNGIKDYSGSYGSSGQVLQSNGAGSGVSWASGGGGSNWTLSGSNLYPLSTATNVGIGTTGPAGKLHVYDATLRAYSLTYGAAAAAIIRNENSELAMGLHNASPWPYWIQARTSGSSARDIALQPLGGNIGIGTAAPGSKLDINTASTTEGVWLDTRASLTGYNGDTWLRLNQNSSWTSGVYTPGFFRADGGIASGGLSTLGAGTIHANGQVRAPIFYDYNNVGYYLDPNSTSNLYILQAYRYRDSSADYLIRAGSGITVSEDADGSYLISSSGGGGVGGGGTTNYLPLWTAGTTLGNSAIIQPDANTVYIAGNCGRSAAFSVYGRSSSNWFSIIGSSAYTTSSSATGWIWSNSGGAIMGLQEASGSYKAGVLGYLHSTSSSNIAGVVGSNGANSTMGALSYYTGSAWYAGYFNGNVRSTGTLQVGNYILPTADGASGQVLKTNGSGTLSWQADNTGGGGSNWTLSGSNLYPLSTATNVGVGTTSPGNNKIQALQSSGSYNAIYGQNSSWGVHGYLGYGGSLTGHPSGWSGAAVYGYSPGGWVDAIYGYAPSGGCGVIGRADDASYYGVWGYHGGGGYAGYFSGNVAITGALQANGSYGSAGQVLTSNGTGAAYWSTVSGGGGTVVVSTNLYPSYDDVSRTSVRSSSCDDCVDYISLGWNFVIGGTSYSYVWVTTNGILGFSTGESGGSASYFNSTLPTSISSLPMLFFHWDDHYGELVETHASGSSPMRTLTIYCRLYSRDIGNPRMYFVITLHEGSNLLTVKYKGSSSFTDDEDRWSSASRAAGSSATIGFQFAGGSSAATVPISYDTRMIDDNLEGGIPFISLKF